MWRRCFPIYIFGNEWHAIVLNCLTSTPSKLRRKIENRYFALKTHMFHCAWDIYRFRKAPISKCFSSSRKRRAGIKFLWFVGHDGLLLRTVGLSGVLAFSNSSRVIWMRPDRRLHLTVACHHMCQPFSKYTRWRTSTVQTDQSVPYQNLSTWNELPSKSALNYNYHDIFKLRDSMHNILLKAGSSGVNIGQASSTNMPKEKFLPIFLNMDRLTSQINKVLIIVALNDPLRD